LLAEITVAVLFGSVWRAVI